MLKKIKCIETQAIKISYNLPPWATDTWCYEQVTFEPILNRLKLLANKFIEANKNDELIKPLIEDTKPSMTGYHSPLYKVLNF